MDTQQWSINSASFGLQSWTSELKFNKYNARTFSGYCFLSFSVKKQSVYKCYYRREKGIYEILNQEYNKHVVSASMAVEWSYELMELNGQ